MEDKSHVSRLSIDTVSDLDDEISADIDRDDPFHSIDDSRVFQVVLSTEDITSSFPTMADLGRDRETARQHESYGNDILDEKNLATSNKPIKPAYDSSRVSAIQLIIRTVGKSVRAGFRRLSNKPAFHFDEESEHASSQYNLRHVCILGLQFGDVAHHIPHSPACAMFYGPVVENVLGRNQHDQCTSTSRRINQQALIHGVKGKDRKVPHTGLKHNALNKTQMNYQKDIYDKSPYLFFIPIMTVDDVRTWTTKKGYDRSYSAVALIGLDDKRMDCRQCADRLKVPCTQDELDTALHLFERYTKALSRLVQETDFTYLINIAPKAMKKEVQKKLEQVNESKMKLKTEGTPILTHLYDHNDLEVVLRKVSFKFEYGKNNIPDPMLVLIKAVVNWSAKNDVKMLPGCPKTVSLCDNCSSESCVGCEPRPTKKNTYPKEILIQCNTDLTDDNEFDSP